jgi:hypothetical protein
MLASGFWVTDLSMPRLYTHAVVYYDQHTNDAHNPTRMHHNRGFGFIRSSNRLEQSCLVYLLVSGRLRAEEGISDEQQWLFRNPLPPHFRILLPIRLGIGSGALRRTL